MSTKTMVTIWALVVFFLTWEHLAINRAPHKSFANQAKVHFPQYKDMTLSTSSNKNWGYALGWAGIGVMLLTNLYIVRKRFHVMTWGKNSNWLNFHIMCGLVGPTMIVFHSNFKVGGLVAISFWSMMIIAISGILGRYFYVQVAGELSTLDREIERWEKIINRMARKSGNDISPAKIDSWKRKFRRYVGADVGTGSGLLFLMSVISHSIMGDMRLALSYPAPIRKLHPESNVALCNYALSIRHKNYWIPFKKALGYWHAFHVPFALVMYIAAAIHIGVALTFHVSH